MSPLKARTVLNDARLSLEDLRCVAADRAMFRRRWVAAIALLRAIGHVLRHVDQHTSSIHREVITRLWKEDKPAIFHEFIDKIRNLTIKEYRTGLFSLAVPGNSPMTIFDNELSAMNTAEIQSYNDESLGYVFRSGPLEGWTADQAIQEAINWWSDYLSG